jgi:signal transduction histidine kinase
MPEASGLLPLDKFAHDLRQPLRGIMLNVQRIRRMDSQLSPELHARLEDLMADARRQEELIASVMEYYSAVHDQLLQNTPIPVSAMIQAACLKVEPFRQLHNGTVHVAACPPVTVTAGLAKALEKLLHNGLKFHAVDVDPVVEIEATVDGAGDIAIRVTDNGLGIEPEYRQSVFEPFCRLHPASDYPGSGMGLPICLRRLELVGGTLAFETPPGSRGLCAVVRIPASTG